MKRKKGKTIKVWEGEGKKRKERQEKRQGENKSQCSFEIIAFLKTV